MKIIELSQGSPEWLTWRKTKITATSSAILMQHNPWSEPLDLWNEMLGFTPPKEVNSAMTRGSELEPTARKLFNEQTGLNFIPIVCESEENPWMAASLDGWDGDNDAILEIKCPKEQTHRLALLGEIPIYYRDQIMHQFGVTQGKICYYVSYRPECIDNPLIVVEVLPDWEYIDQMIAVEKAFYYDNLTCFNPPQVFKFKQRSSNV